MPNIDTAQTFFAKTVESLQKAMTAIGEGVETERIPKKAFFKVAEHHLKEAKRLNTIANTEINTLIEEMKTAIKPPKEIPADAVCSNDGCRWWSKAEKTPFEAMNDKRNATSQGQWGWEHSLVCPLHRLNVAYKPVVKQANVPSSSHPLPSP